MPNAQQELTGLGDEDIYARIEAGPHGRPRLTETGERAPILSTPAPTLPSEQPTHRSASQSVRFDPTETDNPLGIESSQSLNFESVPDQHSPSDDNGEDEPPQYSVEQDDTAESELSRGLLADEIVDITMSSEVYSDTEIVTEIAETASDEQSASADDTDDDSDQPLRYRTPRQRFNDIRNHF